MMARVINQYIISFSIQKDINEITTSLKIHVTKKKYFPHFLVYDAKNSSYFLLITL